MRLVTGRLRPRAILGMVMLIVSILSGFAAGTVSTSAESAAYRWWIRSENPPVSKLVIVPVDVDDWGPYVAANSARLDRWVARPSTAPALAGTYVAVTFVRPITVPLLSATLAPLRGDVAQATSVGQDGEGHLVEEISLRPPKLDDFGSPRFDPAAGYTFTLHGVVACVVQVGTSGVVNVLALEAVRQSALVHLLDTTAIQVQRVDLPAQVSGTDLAALGVLIDSPWRTLDW